jgi:hypothetical protein
LNDVSFFDSADAPASTTCRSPTLVGVERTTANFWPLASDV